MLDFAKIERGKGSYEFGETDLGEVVQALYARGAKWLAGEAAWDAPPVTSGI